MTHVEVAARGFCPQCGAELPLGRSGSTVTCAFCNLTSSYTTVPQPLASSHSYALEAPAIETEHEHYVLRADTGHVVRSAKR